jgi:hypothetical protein
MARCVQCGSETSLYVNGEQLCSQCDDKRQQKQPAATKKQDPKRQ